MQATGYCHQCLCFVLVSWSVCVYTGFVELKFLLKKGQFPFSSESGFKINPLTIIKGNKQEKTMKYFVFSAATSDIHAKLSTPQKSWDQGASFCVTMRRIVTSALRAFGQTSVHVSPKRIAVCLQCSHYLLKWMGKHCMWKHHCILKKTPLGLEKTPLGLEENSIGTEIKQWCVCADRGCTDRLFINLCCSHKYGITT